jgi:hypothetical protein
MKPFIIPLIFSLLCLPFDMTAQTEFKTQGEQEKYWTEQVFHKNYVKYNIERFKGDIYVLNDTTIKYDTTVLKIFTYNDSLLQIFKLGIFYPDVFSKEIVDSIKIRGIQNNRISGLKDKTNLNFSLANDTITISNIEELYSLNPSFKVKRFKFWVFHKWHSNPSIYLIELTNNYANSETGLLDFIIGAKLTFIKKGWLII